MGVDEYYSMTWGNFQRRALGAIKNRWVATREIIAAIETGNIRKRVTGEEVFPFGITAQKEDLRPTEEDRERMRIRRANTEKILRDG